MVASDADSDDDGPTDDSIAYFVANEDEIERRHTHWTQRIAPVLLLVALGIATIVVVPGAYSAYSAIGQSGRVQDHGIRAAGLVVSVSNTERRYIDVGYTYGLRTWVWYRARITVELRSDDETTTVYAPMASPLRVGAQVTVLVDPNDPNYAEFPGQPLEHGGGWILVAILAGLLILLDVYAAIVVGRRLIGRPRNRATPDP